MTEPLFTVPPKLTGRQQLVYDLTASAPLNATAAGVALHRARPQWCSCEPGRPCEWAATNGRQVLEALKRKGLVKRDRHHVYRRTDGQGADSTGAIAAYDPATASWPEGF